MVDKEKFVCIFIPTLIWFRKSIKNSVIVAPKSQRGGTL